MKVNFIVAAIAALVPLVMGYLWYSPMLFHKPWMKENGFTEESLKGGNMPLIFGLSYVFSFFVAITLHMFTIHQWGMFSTLMGEPGFAEGTGGVFDYFSNFMNMYGDRFRTFKHGALHGVLTGVFLALPIMGINALFERKSFKYVAINAGYWIITLAIMGGIICQWL